MKSNYRAIVDAMSLRAAWSPSGPTEKAELYRRNRRRERRVAAARHMTFSVEKGRFEYRGPYEDRFIPKQAGFQWDARLKLWFTESFETAAKLAVYGSRLAIQKLLPILRERGIS